MAEILENKVEELYVPRRIRTMWPALMFAARRKERVKGREKVLIVSTSDRNGLSHCGAPWGSRLAIVALVLKCKADKI